MTRSYRPQDLHQAGRGNPLELAAQGFFWTGGELVDHPAAGKAMRGQQYVEYWIPAELKHETPVVMIHGGGGQGTDFLGTADRREGWVHWFVRHGRAVYVVDRPQHGRSPFNPEFQGEMARPGPTHFLERLFTRPSDFEDNYPQAKLHTQWPGDGTMEDPAFLSFLAGTGPTLADHAESQRDAQRAGAELLERIGPAILLTHSAGGPPGWLIADAKPELVRAIVAVEPLGPPFEAISGPLPFGITHAPLAFDPPLANGETLASMDQPSPGEGLVPYKIQAEPARQLPNLARIPIVVLTAEASWMAADNHAIVHFLRQAGCSVEHLRLENLGIHGNGHAMQLERNSDEIAGAIAGWLEKLSL
ncbi:alpha/beta hydrolase [Alteraurantiacibacter aquimixticola]|uniref:Alpha/beta fold hydrolase n=1 Tax=Alteraurantiacibacter aquimixticola TaxID=2489173 RepID=A0A4T3F5B2_9SPHN|nr:alpha/beta hydrolase [Alteraurantiacibacter aquimixticola]TIX51574.1 alpha/beta fold hydrolase [Alteraurantiacibacter aquimixticola]